MFKDYFEATVKDDGVVVVTAARSRRSSSTNMTAASTIPNQIGFVGASDLNIRERTIPLSF
jgi:hypothetical protein